MPPPPSRRGGSFPEPSPPPTDPPATTRRCAGWWNTPTRGCRGRRLPSLLLVTFLAAADHLGLTLDGFLGSLRRLHRFGGRLRDAHDGEVGVVQDADVRDGDVAHVHRVADAEVLDVDVD